MTWRSPTGIVVLIVGVATVFSGIVALVAADSEVHIPTLVGWTAITAALASAGIGIVVLTRKGPPQRFATPVDDSSDDTES